MRQIPDTSFTHAPNVRCAEHNKLWQLGRLERKDGRYLIHLEFTCGCQETAEIIKGHHEPTYKQEPLLPVRQEGAICEPDGGSKSGAKHQGQGRG